MEWRAKSNQLPTVLMDEKGPNKPTYSTISSEWTRAEGGSDGFLEASHSFLGIKLSVYRPINEGAQSSSIKFRIVNKSQYEPFLEEGERRVCDIIQVYPKEFVFEPRAVLELKLPSCVNSESRGQLVCLYSANLSMRHALKYPKWRPIDSFDFHVNATRTQATITCRQSGLYTVKTTRHLQVTKNLDQCTACEVEIKDHPRIRMKFPIGSVVRKTRITLQTICVDDLYKLPVAAPVSQRLANAQLVPEGLCTSDMMDVTAGPVVLVRPSRFHFARPVHLTLPMLGDQFGDFFAKGNARVAVLRSKVLDAEKMKWQHHYSTPEIEVLSSGSTVASFLITRGGLYKIVRRLKDQRMRSLEQISACISKELRCSETSCKFATTTLRGLVTEIAEPGKQFVLRAALFDASQPQNPDECFTRMICCQPLSLPLGKVRFLVRGSFEPDRDAADNAEERTVTFTGKTTFVDFHLKLKLSDPTKLPDVIGKVTLFGEGDVVFYTNLHKPAKIEEADASYTHNEPRPRDKMKKPNYAQKRKTVAKFRNDPDVTQFEHLTDGSLTSSHTPSTSQATEFEEVWELLRSQCWKPLAPGHTPTILFTARTEASSSC